MDDSTGRPTSHDPKEQKGRRHRRVAAGFASPRISKGGSMKYTVSPDGSIMRGNTVALHNPEQASANVIAEALQDAADRAYKQAVDDVCERVRDLQNGPPDENRSTVVQRSTNHGRRVGL